MKIHKPFGLDLGTTNCTASIFIDGGSFCAEEARKKTIPSIVARRDGEFIVGAFAKNHPEIDNIKSVKRKMGKSDLVLLDGCDYAPEEISAEIIKHCAKLLNEQVEKGDNVIYDRVVVTVPAYFSIAQKDATRKAGELAGLDVVMLLEEPTAAAINYTVKNDIDNGIYMVYDLGGGTFDVSIIEKIDSIPIVLATAGNNYLGGDNFDNILARYFLDILNEGGYDIRLDMDREEDARKYKCLLLAAENTKKNLTNAETYSISIFDIFKDNSSVDLIIDDFSRQQFEDLIRDKIVIDSFKECQRALDIFVDNGRSVSEIDGILLVGGSSKIPLIRQELQKHFVETGVIRRIVSADPDLAVGYGAGIVAATMSTIVEDNDSGIRAEINAPYCFDDTTSISGKIEEGNVDKVKFNSCSKSWESAVDADGEFSIEVDEIPDSYEYEFISGSKTELVFSEASEKNNLIAPTPVQNETIRIEIVDLEKQEILDYPLVERGETLPCIATHDFLINEYSRNQIVLPVKEGYRESYRLIINPPSNVKIGSKVSVTVDVDTVANVTLSVKLDGKPISGEKVYPSGHKVGEEKDKVESQFNKKISNVKYEERAEFFERKDDIERELSEAEANKDKSHYSDVMDKYESMVHELPDVAPTLCEDDFDSIKNEIEKLAEKAENFDLDNVKDQVYFGKRAIRRGDFKQAQNRYDNLCGIKDVLMLKQDSKRWFMMVAGAVLEVLNSAENIMYTVSDPSLQKSISDECSSIHKSINNFIGNGNIDNKSDSEYQDMSDLLISKMQRLSALLEQTGSREINEKIAQFQGRVSKA